LDPRDFRCLATLELPAVYRLAHHLCGCAQDVDDVVQETYLHALKGECRFQLREQGLRPWLFKILHNVLHARYGKSQREARLLERLGTDGDGLHQKSTDGNPADCTLLSGIAWDQVDERLKHAIDELPMSYKSVFLLSAVEGLRYHEIAQVIDAPVGTVMSRLHRARGILARELQDLAVEINLRPSLHDNLSERK